MQTFIIRVVLAPVYSSIVFIAANDSRKPSAPQYLCNEWQSCHIPLIASQDFHTGSSFQLNKITKIGSVSHCLLKVLVHQSRGKRGK